MIEEEWDDKTSERLIWDTLTSSLQSYFQGIGPIGYVPAMILNILTNKPAYFNLPPVASKIGDIGNILKKLISGEDISKESVDLLMRNIRKISEAAEDDGLLVGLFEQLIGRKKEFKVGDDGMAEDIFKDPLYDYMVKGKPFKVPKYITVPVKEKEEKAGYISRGRRRRRR